MKPGINKTHNCGALRILTQLLLLICFGLGSIIQRTPAVLGRVKVDTGASADSARSTARDQANASAKPELVPQVDTPAGTRLAFSSDGRLIASLGRDDSAVRLWEVATGRELRTFSAGDQTIHAVAFSPDGKLLAAQSGDQAVQIWDVITGRESTALTLPDQTGGGTGPGDYSAAIRNGAIAFGSGGRILAATNGRTVALWDITSGNLIRSISPDSVQGFSLNPDGREMALLVIEATETEITLPKGKRPGGFSFPGIGRGPNGLTMTVPVPTLKIIDVNTGKDTRNEPLAGGRSGSSGQGLASLPVAAYGGSLSYGADGHLFIAGSDRLGGMKVWDATTKRELPTLSTSGSPQLSTHALSPDGRLLAAGEMKFSVTDQQSATNSVWIWDTATGREVKVLAPHSGPISAIAFSPDGRSLATSGDNTIRLWDTSTWANIRTLAGHSNVPLRAQFSRDGRRLFTGNKTIWDLATGTGLPARGYTAPGQDFTSPAMSPDGQLVAMGADKSRIRVVDTDAGREISMLGQSDESASAKLALFSPDGRVLASIYKDSFKQILSGVSLPSSSGTGQITRRVIDPTKDLPRHSELAHEIKLWDVGSGHELWTLVSDKSAGSFWNSGEVESITFSPDGRVLASASEAPGAQAGGNPQRVSAGPGPQPATTKSGKGRGIPGFGVNRPIAPPTATGTLPGGVITLWDVATGQQARSISSGLQSVGSLAISQNGHLIAAQGRITNYNIDYQHPLNRKVDYQTVIKVWDIDTGRELHSFSADARGYAQLSGTAWVSVTALAFSPDNNTLASAGADKTIDLWDLSSGQKLRTLTGGSSSIVSIAFSPNGAVLVSSCSDGTLLWEVQTGKRLATLISLQDGDDWMVVTPDGLFDGSPAAWNQILWRYDNDTFAVAPVEWFFNEFYYPGLLADIISGKRPQAVLDISTKDRRQPKVSLSLPNGQTSADGSVSSRSVKVRIDITGAEAGARDLRLFRNGSMVKVWHGDIVNGQPTAAIEADIPIVAGVNRLTAYAFNHDNVKSVDAVLPVAGAASLKRTGTLYILAIGVNSYTNPEYNLHYAAPDAKAFADEVRRQQGTQGNYSKTEVISLFDAEATKHNIMLALYQFGANGKGALPAGAPPSLRKFTPVEPEDAVIVYYAGHGTAQESRFYLIPHDLGYTGRRNGLDAKGLQAILDHSISDQELEQAFEAIDAGRLLLIVDACNSGQALDAEEKRRGPMNSKGLAQLAYEKGMYILTAAQSYQAALEASQLGHGYLTYALVEEGLKTAAADTSPKDGQVTIREWLDYATGRVPQMQQAKMRDSRDLLHKPLAFVEGDEKVDDVEKRNVQRPRVFYRRELEAQPMVVAKLPLEK